MAELGDVQFRRGCGPLAAAEPAAWRVVSVRDGDTLTALDAANVQHKVRLTGIATTCPHYVAGSLKVVGA